VEIIDAKNNKEKIENLNKDPENCINEFLRESLTVLNEY
jgi:hypothetical protein